MKIKGRNNKDYEYERVCVYFDKTDEKQKNCLEVFGKLPKKKAAFVAVLVEDFLEKFEGDVSSDDIKAYIENHDTFKKYKILSSVPAVMTATNTSRDDNQKPKNNPIDKENNLDDIMGAMNMFSVD